MMAYPVRDIIAPCPRCGGTQTTGHYLFCRPTQPTVGVSHET